MNKKLFSLFLVPTCICMGLLSLILAQAEETPFQEPLGLPPIEWPIDNPYSKKKAELGKLLFFDKRLSTDESISCSSCHSIPKAFSDHASVSKGIHDREGTRHSPSIINVALNKTLFWDGRAATLEVQVTGPLSNPNEMTLRKNKEKAFKDCEKRLMALPGYLRLFEEAFGHPKCTIEDVAQAISTFERTILSGNSAFDRYQAGDAAALTEEQLRGYEVFQKSGCINCHHGPNFTSNGFANIGIGMDKANPDLGRFEVTKEDRDWGAFKIPTLRESSHTYPYMHDGSLKTLEEVVDHYNKGGIPNSHLHPAIHPLNLSEEEKRELIAFLKSLDGEGWEDIHVPHEFPH